MPLKVIKRAVKNEDNLAKSSRILRRCDRAISIVELALEIHGAPIYVRHEVVHNRFVVNGLRERGAIFVEELSEVPDGAIVISLLMVCHKPFVKKRKIVS